MPNTIKTFLAQEGESEHDPDHYCCLSLSDKGWAKFEETKQLIETKNKNTGLDPTNSDVLECIITEIMRTGGKICESIDLTWLEKSEFEVDEQEFIKAADNVIRKITQS